MKRLKALGCGLAVSTVAAAVAFLIVEIFLRLFFPQPLFHDPDAFIPDSVLGARLKPGFTDRVVTTEFTSTWKINDDGHRGPRASHMSGGTRRIVAIGDSFTFGYGVEEEESWPRQFETLLNSKLSREKVEVINLGVGGYGTWEETKLLMMEYDRLQPDMVILGFYVGNDPADNTREYRRRNQSRLGNFEIVAPGSPPRVERLKRWLGSRLHSYSLVSMRGDELLVRLGMRKLVLPFELDILRRPMLEPVDEAWAATREALEELVLLCSSRHVPLLVVVIPMKHQVDDAVWDRILEYYGELEDGIGFDRQAPQREVNSILDSMEVSLLDLRPGLKQVHKSKGEPLYWLRDQHWRRTGHEAAAGVITEYLLSEGWGEPDD